MSVYKNYFDYFGYNYVVCYTGSYNSAFPDVNVIINSISHSSSTLNIKIYNNLDSPENNE